MYVINKQITNKPMTKEQKIKNLKAEKKAYKKAYYELHCYFDSISEEEQDKVYSRLKLIFLKLKNKKKLYKIKQT